MFLIIIIFLLTSSISASQTKTNLEIFYSLVDSSVAVMINEIPENKKDIYFELNLGDSYNIFNNKIITAAAIRKFTIVNGINNGVKINYVLDNAKVKYGDIFRDGFLGDYYSEREIKISGNYIISDENFNANSFSYSKVDTVKVDEIKTLENISFPFTQGEIPPEPFFSSLVEPIIAIGTAAVAIFLFFSIRSN